jgi:hypothetical protein
MSSSTVIQKKILRKDIQALRAIAIIAVVLFHLWPARLTGGFIGVDVFFVISGFLITTHILGEVKNNSFKISLFWIRRIRRLLPASFTVLAVTGIAVIVLVPVQLWLQWLKEIQASILYFENWILALDSVDYLALSNEASPTQHFWSLSVEEQFYLVWPVLIAVAIMLVRKSSLKTKKFAMLAILSLVTICSFIYGVYLTKTEPAIAYFSTPVRAWEFGFGALMAFAPKLKQPLMKWLFSLLGLALIAYSSLTYTTALAFPGLWALLPVLGTCLVILASSNEGVLGSVFGFKPLAWLGERSYSIYLWHWPIIILLPYALKGDLNTQTKILSLVLTLVIASLSTAYIERPFLAGGRVPRYKPAVVFGALLVVSSLVVGSLAFGIERAKVTIAAEKKKADDEVKAQVQCFGAGARAPGKAPCSNPMLKGVFPALSSAATDSYWPDKCGITARDDAKPVACQVGSIKASIRIALVGDSHAKHYTAAFADLAKSNNWSVEVYAKGGCPFSDVERARESETWTVPCTKYVSNLEQILFEKKYDLVVTSQKSGVKWTTRKNQSQEEAGVKGLVSAWSSLIAEGIPILAIKDNPVPIPKVIRCLEIKPVGKCLVKRKDSILLDPQVEAVTRFANNQATLINFDDIYCGESTCSPVIGNVVVYRDTDHLTSTFTRTLARFLKPYIEAALAK